MTALGLAEVRRPRVAATVGRGSPLTRRSMPLAGVGATMILMSLALHWVGPPLPAAVAGTVVYRAVGLVPLSLVGLRARARLEHREPQRA